jgi:hypothetical protein
VQRFDPRDYHHREKFYEIKQPGSRLLAPGFGEQQTLSYFPPLLDETVIRWLDCASANQPFTRRQLKMTENYIIETPHGAAGLVIRDRRGFRFFSANREFDALDGKAFANPQSAAAAAIQQAQRISRAARLSSATSFTR